jgi:hypothetical protein
VRYKLWRSNKDKSLHVLCREGSGAFEALASVVKHMGPWTGGREGAVDQLRPVLSLDARKSRRSSSSALSTTRS